MVKPLMTSRIAFATSHQQHRSKHLNNNTANHNRTMLPQPHHRGCLLQAVLQLQCRITLLTHQIPLKWTSHCSICLQPLSIHRGKQSQPLQLRRTWLDMMLSLYELYTW